ncbi:hypothetical protein S140_9 [Shewanella sp. phage 1/40]|uniref:RIIB lysis inhibitor n=1 Tax=Shewanella sp. phage 1/40 TaxID=1458860 RepID=UPI0004F60F57|nr:RIIB lysis inhibitor [Shewanella sp. phage 1/40]AHK11419.1 hypothetical protein S140_9 [Shewanella sp. phage 1/40]
MSKRSNVVKCKTAQEKVDIFNGWVKQQELNKTQYANLHGISLRTFSRILDECDQVAIVQFDYTVTKDAITIFRNDESRIVVKGYPKFKKLRSKLIEDDFSDDSLHYAFELLSLPTFIAKFSEGNITVCHEEGKIFYGTFEIKNSLVTHMFDILSRGEDVLPMVRFLDMLMDNPKESIVDELYPFMQHNDIEINEDGTIKAYRNVTMDYKDHHTGKMDNSVGKVVKMPRTMVDSDPNNTCSSGIHCASIGYAKSFGGGRLMEVKVNPSHVCSVPTDYAGMKMRVCELLIVVEVV